MAGLENIIGTGSAQILPRPASMMPLVEQLNQQKQQKFQREKYEQAKKEQDQKELYGLVGDALNLKDFNPVMQEEVNKAQKELTQKFLVEKPSLGKGYLDAQNAAGTLMRKSQAYNHADQVITANKKEFEGDKDLNLANVEAITRKYVKDAVDKDQYDPNKNYFVEAMRDNPSLALVGGGGTPKFNFQTEELLPDVRLHGVFKEIRPRGGYDQKNWQVAGKVAPAFYDFKNNGEELPPTITTRSEPSKIFNGVPMLSEDAWKRYKAVTSNEIKLDAELRDMYGGQLDLRSPEAEELRRIRAYEEVEKMKPPIIKSRIEKADSIKIYNSSGGSGSSAKTEKAQAVADANNWLSNTQSAINNKDINAINSQFQILERGGRFVDINASYDKGGNIVVKYSTPNTDGDFKEISRTFKNDANLQNQLKGLYQSLTGEDKVFEYSNPATNNTGSKYKIKGKPYTEAELLKMGYTVEQIKPYKQ